MKIFLYLTCIALFFSSCSVDNADIFESKIVIKDHKFVPSIVKIPKDRKVRLTIYNDDPTVEEFESVDLKREKIIQGNSHINIILAPLNVGEYSFMGEFHPETAKGCILVE